MMQGGVARVTTSLLLLLLLLLLASGSADAQVVLTDGVPAGPYTVADGALLSYSIDITSAPVQVDVEVEGGGFFDEVSVYVRGDAPPTLSVFDAARDDGLSGDQFCSFDVLRNGTFYISIYGRDCSGDCTGDDITATLHQYITVLEPGVPITTPDHMYKDSWRHYRMDGYAYIGDALEFDIDVDNLDDISVHMCVDHVCNDTIAGDMVFRDLAETGDISRTDVDLTQEGVVYLSLFGEDANFNAWDTININSIVAAASGVLTNGVASIPRSVAEDEIRHYVFNLTDIDVILGEAAVFPLELEVDVDVTFGADHVDVFVREGAPATDALHDFASISEGGDHRHIWYLPRAGVWYISVLGDFTSIPFTTIEHAVTASISNAPPPQQLPGDGQASAALDAAAGAVRHFFLDLASDEDFDVTLRVGLANPLNSVDVYMRVNASANATHHDVALTGHGAGSVSASDISLGGAGRYHVAVYVAECFSCEQVTLSVSVTSSLPVQLLAGDPGVPTHVPVDVVRQFFWQAPVYGGSDNLKALDVYVDLSNGVLDATDVFVRRGQPASSSEHDLAWTDNLGDTRRIINNLVDGERVYFAVSGDVCGVGLCDSVAFTISVNVTDVQQLVPGVETAEATTHEQSTRWYYYDAPPAPPGIPAGQAIWSVRAAVDAVFATDEVEVCIRMDARGDTLPCVSTSGPQQGDATRNVAAAAGQRVFVGVRGHTCVSVTDCIDIQHSVLPSVSEIPLVPLTGSVSSEVVAGVFNYYRLPLPDAGVDAVHFINLYLDISHLLLTASADLYLHGPDVAPTEASFIDAATNVTVNVLEPLIGFDRALSRRVDTPGTYYVAVYGAGCLDVCDTTNYTLHARAPALADPAQYDFPLEVLVLAGAITAAGVLTCTLVSTRNAARSRAGKDAAEAETGDGSKQQPPPQQQIGCLRRTVLGTGSRSSTWLRITLISLAVLAALLFFVLQPRVPDTDTCGMRVRRWDLLEVAADVDVLLSVSNPNFFSGSLVARSVRVLHAGSLVAQVSGADLGTFGARDQRVVPVPVSFDLDFDTMYSMFLDWFDTGIIPFDVTADLTVRVGTSPPVDLPQITDSFEVGAPAEGGASGCPAPTDIALDTEHRR